MTRVTQRHLPPGTIIQIQNWWQPQAQRRSRIPLPGRPVLVRVAAFRPETKFPTTRKLSAADECQRQQTVILRTNPEEKRSVESRVKEKKKLTDFSRRIGPLCVSQLFFSHNTHTRFNCTEIRRRRLIKRNYSKCMVLKKEKKKFFTSDSKRHTVQHTQR